jgi:hypothetical protein
MSRYYTRLDAEKAMSGRSSLGQSSRSRPSEKETSFSNPYHPNLNSGQKVAASAWILSAGHLWTHLVGSCRKFSKAVRTLVGKLCVWRRARHGAGNTGNDNTPYTFHVISVFLVLDFAPYKFHCLNLKPLSARRQLLLLFH